MENVDQSFDAVGETVGEAVDEEETQLDVHAEWDGVSVPYAEYEAEALGGREGALLEEGEGVPTNVADAKKLLLCVTVGQLVPEAIGVVLRLRVKELQEQLLDEGEGVSVELTLGQCV